MQSRSTFQNPKKQIVIVTVVVGILYWYQVYRSGWPSLEDYLMFIALKVFFPQYQEQIGLPENVNALWQDMWLLAIMFLVWIAFFSQYVLPLNHTRERFWVVVRLLLYMVGQHGPAIFIRDGEVIQRKREMEKPSWGVVVLDTASAAVLRSALAFTRTVGPGTVFTRRFEKVAGAVSLYRQSQMVGPKPGEDPFAPQGEDESDEAYQDRMQRRWETSALTRDGVEIVPNILTTFQLDDDPYDEKTNIKPQTPNGTEKKARTQFVCDLVSVERAIRHESVDPQERLSSQARYQSWNNLPAYLAVDVWRELVRKFKLDELFTFATINPAERTLETAYEKISKAVRERLTQKYVEKLDEFGNPTGIQIESQEYKILKERGIKVQAAAIANLRFERKVEEKLVAQWRANWLERAKEEERYVRQQRSLAAHQGYEIALQDFAVSASRLPAAKLSQQSLPDLNAVLEFLVRGTLEQCIRDPELHQYLTNEKQDIVSLIEWIRSN